MCIVRGWGSRVRTRDMEDNNEVSGETGGSHAPPMICGGDAREYLEA